MIQLTLATLIGVFLSLPAAATCLGKEALPAAKTFATRHHDFYTADPVKLYGKIEARLLAALATDYRCRDAEICAIAADPWIAAQDGDIRKPEFTLVSATDLRAQVEMRYTYTLATTRRPQNVRLHLARGSTQACWLVADLIGPDGASLVQHIEDWHNRNTPAENSPHP